MNKQLQRALERLVAGNSATAVENLRGFVRQVTDLTAAGKLTHQEAALLLERARTLIRRLDTGEPPESAGRGQSSERD